MNSPNNTQMFVDHVDDCSNGRGYYDFVHEWPFRKSMQSILVENQEDADREIPWLKRGGVSAITKCRKAEINIVWAELSGPVDIIKATPCGYYCDETAGHVDHSLGFIDWIILSGSQTEPTDLTWLRRVIADCRTAGVPVWLRNVGAKPYDVMNRIIHCQLILRNPTGSNPAEWPHDMKSAKELPKFIINMMEYQNEKI